MSYQTVAGHRTMALDRHRNAMYARALASVIGPETVVLDPGAGTGILGLIAARLGARHVYLVEPGDMAAVALDIVRANGLESRVTVLQERMERVSLPGRVDVIVSALTGNFLLTEDLIGLLPGVRDRLLKPGGHLLPSAAVMEVAPVTAEALHESEIASWSRAEQGVDLSAARPFAANSIYYKAKEVAGADWIGSPVDLKAFDFRQDADFAVHADVSCTIERDAICHGWLGWFRMRLGDQWLSTSPRAVPVHWSPAFLPVDPPVPVEAGERVGFRLDREPRGDWAWHMRAAAGTRTHSTFLSMPLSERLLAQAAGDFRPRASGEGRAVAAILSSADGIRTVETIAREVHRRFPEEAPTAEDALRLVQAVSKRYG